MKVNKLLLITSSGGGGLLQAANAQEQEMRIRNPQIVIVRKDLLMDWMGRRFGRFCAEKWNRAQVKGDVAELSFLIASQRFFDYFGWPYIFLCTLYTLLKEKVDHVIDTQPIGTSAMLKALRLYNAIKKKRLILQKVLVDLPTEAATHFYGPMRRLTKWDRPLLRVTTIAPLLEEGETRASFWYKTCRLSEKEVHYADLNVRHSFRALQNRAPVEGDYSLKFLFKNDEELQLMERCWRKGQLHGVKIKEGTVTFSLARHVKLIALLLGSQPASDATLNYVKNWIQVAKTLHSMSPCTLCVFSNEHTPGQNTLFRQVVEIVESTREYPSHLTVVPFSFQDDDVIAPLFYRSDLACTRSGGQTAMELMAVSHKEIWIHSEAKQQGETPLSMEALLRGIPGWEAANARYLQRLRKAKIVTPETFASYVPAALR